MDALEEHDVVIVTLIPGVDLEPAPSADQGSLHSPAQPRGDVLDSRSFGTSTSEMFQSHYPAVCRLARSHLSREWSRRETEPGSLATAAYIRMSTGARVYWESERRFFAALHVTMKRILIEMARSHRARKREGLHMRVDLNDVTLYERDSTLERLESNLALERIREQSPRQCEVLRLRFIKGMSIKETACALSVSESTVKKDCQRAKTTLTKTLRQEIAFSPAAGDAAS